MYTMVTKKPHRYGNRQYAVGDEFEVRGESDHRLVKALGWADDKPPGDDRQKASPPVAPPPAAAVVRARGGQSLAARAMRASAPKPSQADPNPAEPASPTVPRESVGRPIGAVGSDEIEKTGRYSTRDLRAEE